MKNIHIGRKDNTIAAIAMLFPLEVLRAFTPRGKLITPTNAEMEKQPIPIVEVISLLLPTATSKIRSRVPNTKNNVETIPNTNDVTAKPLQ